MNSEERDYEKEFKIVKLVAVVQPASACILLIIAELMKYGIVPVQLSPLIDQGTLNIIRTVFYILAAGIILLAVLLKQTIKNPVDGIIQGVLKWLIKQNHARRQSSAVALLIPPSALGEMCAILGFVLFILSGGNRQDLYILVVSGLAAMFFLFPTEREKNNLVKLDKEVP